MPTVVVVTTKADRGYVRGQQRQAARPAGHVPERHASSTGQALAPACPGDCFYDDGIHLPPDGRTYYAQQIVAVTG